MKTWDWQLMLIVAVSVFFVGTGASAVLHREIEPLVGSTVIAGDSATDLGYVRILLGCLLLPGLWLYRRWWDE